MGEKTEAIICTILGFTVGGIAVAVSILKVEPALWRWIIKRAEKSDV